MEKGRTKTEQQGTQQDWIKISPQPGANHKVIQRTKNFTTAALERSAV